MKVLCPICGIMGSMQKRGNSVRVGHYKGYREETRIIEWHATTLQAIEMVNNTMVNNGYQTHNLENKNGANVQLSRGRGLESRPRHQTEAYCFRVFPLKVARLDIDFWCHAREASAWSRSAMRSSASSMPTEYRIKLSGIPMASRSSGVHST